MYWRFKAPLIILLIALVVGIFTLIWRNLIQPHYQNRQPLVQENEVTIAPKESTPDSLPVPVLQEPKEQQPEKSDEFAKTFDDADNAMQADNPKKARELAQSILKSGKCEQFDDNWMRAAKIINDANKIFMNGKAPCPEKRTYVVVSGDSLTKIAYRNNSTIEGLQRLNKLSTTSAIIHPGDVLQYINGVWSIKVSKSHFLLMLYLDDDLYRIYQISTGRQDRTPAGTFIIKDKEFQPAWTPPGQNIPYGDPRNILGTRWMGLKPVEGTDTTLRGYGIHGTTEPETIGTAASLGCIRMKNEEVEELYDFIPLDFAKQQIKVVIEE